MLDFYFRSITSAIYKNEFTSTMGLSNNDLKPTITETKELKSKICRLSSCHNIIYFN